MIKYLTHHFEVAITPVTVESETDLHVVVKGRTRKKRSGYEQFSDSWDQAKSVLLEAANYAKEIAERDLRLATKHFAEIEAMQNPEEQ